MLRLLSRIALLIVTLFSAATLTLSLDHPIAAAMETPWQIIFVKHIAQVGLAGQVMNLDGNDVQPVKIRGQPVYYLDCSPDGNSFVFAADASAYVAAASGDDVRPIQADSISAIDLSVSNSGEVIFNGIVNGSEGVYVNAAGLQHALAGHHPDAGFGFGVMYDLSPDGRRIAYHTPVGAHLYVVGRNDDSFAQLPGAAFGAAWSPDGTMVAFAADWDRNFEIYVLDVIHSITAQLTHRTRGYGNTFPAWSPDSRQIMFVSSTATGLGSSYGGELYIVNMDGSDQRRLVHFEDEVVMGCLLTARPESLVADS
jgi:dipeptidyl aminopeptidase/acylaminoacyl peptidase